MNRFLFHQFSRLSSECLASHLMENLFVSPRTPETLENLRKSFVDADEKPAMSELAEKFGIPISTIYRRASEEQWNEQRAARLERLNTECDAKEIIVRAASRTDSTLMRAFTDTVLVGLQRLTAAIQRIPEDQASSTQIETINSSSFAFKNFADGCRSLGIGSFAKELGKLGKEDNGRWDPKMLQQINIQVGAMAAQAGAGPAVAQAAPVAEVASSPAA